MTGTQMAQLVADRIAAAVPAAKVYNMLADKTNDLDFAKRYSIGGRIFAFEVTREDSAGNDGETTNAVSRMHGIVAYGWMSYKDGISEPIFQAAMDAITAVFDPPDSNTRTFAGQCDWSGPLQVQGPKFGNIGGVLCHFARLTYPIKLFPIY